MFCGGFAGMISTLATYPLDLARARLAVSPLLFTPDYKLSYPYTEYTPESNLVKRGFYVLEVIKKWIRTHGVRDMYRYEVKYCIIYLRVSLGYSF
jgi:hypothetical protein